ncbi:hypothetical protein B0J11DRAFT_506567 [Dendryphion nanum]|uniref:Uncharacterized protein n=1 Tax=Dendryphion nanum TaxID=256645 RepID=A0A9P9INP5_9PLEO|nr:hypothetical protein B0J11DRAFT_506567 [Dendryphion nanum]
MSHSASSSSPSSLSAAAALARAEFTMAMATERASTAVRASVASRSISATTMAENPGISMALEAIELKLARARWVWADSLANLAPAGPGRIEELVLAEKAVIEMVAEEIMTPLMEEYRFLCGVLARSQK